MTVVVKYPTFQSTTGTGILKVGPGGGGLQLVCSMPGCISVSNSADAVSNHYEVSLS